MDKIYYGTPDVLFSRYNDRYRFVLDAAANQFNHKCPSYFGPGGVCEDALTADWLPWLKKGNIWLNPPYSRGLQRRFVEKAIAEVDQSLSGYVVVALLPADTSTKLFHEVLNERSEIQFLKGRIRFKRAPAAAKFGSMIVVLS